MNSAPAPFVTDAIIGSDWLTWNRRRRTRLRVQWRLRFHVDKQTALETVTQDLSSEGFYCVIGFRFVPGEAQDCVLHVPARDPNDLGRSVAVPCRVRIVRVEGLAETGLYGVACHVENYHFVEGPIERGL